MNMFKGLTVDTKKEDERKAKRSAEVEAKARQMAKDKASANMLDAIRTGTDDTDNTPNAQGKKKTRTPGRAMTPHEADRIKTAKAYEMFSLLDVDGSGRVSQREMERFLAGDTRHTLVRDFPDNDVGIHWDKTSRNEVMMMMMMMRRTCGRRACEATRTRVARCRSLVRASASLFLTRRRSHSRSTFSRHVSLARSLVPCAALTPSSPPRPTPPAVSSSPPVCIVGDDQRGRERLSVGRGPRPRARPRRDRGHRRRRHQHTQAAERSPRRRPGRALRRRKGKG